ncbi:MAG TPA: glycosyltransferase [Gaiellaceae bacterium]
MPVIEVAKPELHLGRLAIQSAVRRRSLIHTRFAPRSLQQALTRIEADVFVARRVYMAEAALDAERVPPRDRLVVVADVLESTVLRLRGPLASVEARRTRHDEIRCVRAASRVAFLSDCERDELASHAPGSSRLDLVLPPAESPAPLDTQTAVFVGDRRALANEEALRHLLAIWPNITRKAPNARLLIVGEPGQREPRRELQGVMWSGFVDDLDKVWRSAAVLLAPVATGGGVRVKVLDAARHGVPVVGTRAAIGSTDSYLPLAAYSAGDDLVDAAVGLLTDLAARRRLGADLYEANRTLNARGFVEEQVASLLAPG